MQLPSSVMEIARAIQLAVAPVFLLSGVALTLSVLINRLTRIVDRARVLEERLRSVGEAEQPRLRNHLTTLSRRAHLVNRAITLSTVCALLVCVVIASLFLGAFLALDLSRVIALLFVAAMLAFIGALISFLREVFLATASLRIGPG
jgi:hypothetical protein